ncbi:MAG: NNP family nitrate/nitrite transporter-like MFS transporter, partial [Halieaceae bacterium]
MTLSTADQALFSYAIPGILREFDIGLDVVGLLLSTSFAVAAFTVVIAGALTDRLGRVRVFAILLAASAACVGLHVFAANLSLLALFRILGFALAAGM